MTQAIMSLVSDQETSVLTEQRAAAIAEHAKIKAIWKTLSDAKQITSQDAAALCLLRSLTSEDTENTTARLFKSFSPITNKNKLANGSLAYGSLRTALWMLKYSAFAKQLPETTQLQMAELAKATVMKGLK